jgi:carboxymethylenebutenolidase
MVAMAFLHVEIVAPGASWGSSARGFQKRRGPVTLRPAAGTGKSFRRSHRKTDPVVHGRQGPYEEEQVSTNPMPGHAGVKILLLALGVSVGACGPRGADQVATQDHTPPGEANALAVLNASPRHGEMVDVPRPEGGTPIRTWVVYPERPDKAGVVIVIHEIYGLSDWIRSVGDALAREGFIAVVPDLVSGMGPGGGGTESAATRDDVVKMVRGLSPEETASRLAAVRDYALKLPSANGRWGSIGFCWGGARSFELAASVPASQADVVFYGVTPDSVTLLRVTAPVEGHYGGDDARVNATIPAAKAALSASGRHYESHVYQGAGHGFLRAQDERDGANLRAAREAWPKAVSFLERHLD